MLGRVAVQISSSRADLDGLIRLAPLWVELHRHHLEVSDYEDLVADVDLSWARRLDWYRHLVAEGPVRTVICKARMPDHERALHDLPVAVVVSLAVPVKATAPLMGDSRVGTRRPAPVKAMEPST